MKNTKDVNGLNKLIDKYLKQPYFIYESQFQAWFANDPNVHKISYNTYECNGKRFVVCDRKLPESE